MISSVHGPMPLSSVPAWRVVPAPLTWPGPVCVSSCWRRPTAWALAGLTARDALLPADALKRLPDRTTSAALARAGLSTRAIDNLLRPFLAGVFLEDEPATGRYGSGARSGELRADPPRFRPTPAGVPVRCRGSTVRGARDGPRRASSCLPLCLRARCPVPLFHDHFAAWSFRRRSTCRTTVQHLFAARGRSDWFPCTGSGRTCRSGTGACCSAVTVHEIPLLRPHP